MYNGVALSRKDTTSYTPKWPYSIYIDILKGVMEPPDIYRMIDTIEMRNIAIARIDEVLSRMDPFRRQIMYVHYTVPGASDMLIKRLFGFDREQCDAIREVSILELQDPEIWKYFMHPARPIPEGALDKLMRTDYSDFLPVVFNDKVIINQICDWAKIKRRQAVFFDNVLHVLLMHKCYSVRDVMNTPPGVFTNTKGVGMQTYMFIVYLLRQFGYDPHVYDVWGREVYKSKYPRKVVGIND